MALTTIDDRGLKTPIDLLDNEKIRFGTGNDFELYHDGTHNQFIASSGYIKLEATTNDLYLRGNTVWVQSGDGNETFAKLIDNGAVELYYDNSKKFETTSGGAQIVNGTGNAQLNIRGGSSDGTATIQFTSDDNAANNDNFRLQNGASNDFYLQNYASGSWETNIKATGNGNVELYYDNSKKLYTESSGVAIDGDLSIESNGYIRVRSTGDNSSTAIQLGNDGTASFTGVVSPSSHVDMPDNAIIKLGTGDDLQIYHNGTHSFLQHTYGSGNFFIESAANIAFKVAGNESALNLNSNGAVELYHDNVKTFETLSDGIHVKGPEGGAGLIKLSADEGDDNNDNWLFMANTDNSLLIRNLSDGSWDTSIKCAGDGAVELYYDDSKKFETTSTGTTTTGNHVVSGLVACDGLLADDNEKIKLGSGEDLEIYHDGSHNHIRNTVANQNIYIEGVPSEGGTPVIQLNPRRDSVGISVRANNAVELYFDGSKKIETTNSGQRTSGDITLYGELNLMHASSDSNKFIDAGFNNNNFYFRRTNYQDGGHANWMVVGSNLVASADFNDTSDEKLKENIATISDGAISKIKQLRPVTFDWKDSTRNNNVSGFIAQEIKTVLPNLVYGTEYDPTLNDPAQGTKGGIKSAGYSVNTIGIVANLTKALQEAIAKIETLETKVAALESS